MSGMRVGNTTSSTPKEPPMPRPATVPATVPSHRDAIIATIARTHLGLETLESRSSDSLDFHEHGSLAIRDALRAAFEAGKRNAHRTERKPTVIFGDLVITSKLPKDGTPGWTSGRIGAFSFNAKVYIEHATIPYYEIGRSRISKLELRRLDTDEIAYAWDRGLDIAAVDAAAQAAVDTVARHLARLVFSNEAEG
jgi:hypothetical protein